MEETILSLVSITDATRKGMKRASQNHAKNVDKFNALDINSKSSLLSHPCCRQLSQIQASLLSASDSKISSIHQQYLQLLMKLLVVESWSGMEEESVHVLSWDRKLAYECLVEWRPVIELKMGELPQNDYFLNNGIIKPSFSTFLRLNGYDYSYHPCTSETAIVHVYGDKEEGVFWKDLSMKYDAEERAAAAGGHESNGKQRHDKLSNGGSLSQHANIAYTFMKKSGGFKASAEEEEDMVCMDESWCFEL
jgi:hypothetical protein